MAEKSHLVPAVDLAHVPKLPPDSVRLLWVNDWHEGPREAMAEYAGARCLMVLRDDDPPSVAESGKLCWVLYRLSAEQCVSEDEWHQLFAEHVGEHWCFHGGDHPPPSSARPEPSRFFAACAARPPLDLRQSDVVGWLEEVPHG